MTGYGLRLRNVLEVITMKDFTNIKKYSKTVRFKAKIIKETDKWLKAMVLYKKDRIDPFYFSKKQIQIERHSTIHIIITYQCRLAIKDKLISRY